VEYLYAVVILVMLYIGFRVWSSWYRLVYRLALPSSEFEECVMPWVRSGGNGHHISIFHQRSGVMILIKKHLPLNVPEAKVSLRVTKMRIPQPAKYQPQRGRESVVRQWTFRWVPWRYLPSAKKGEILERVNCGGSLKRTFAQVYRMIREEPGIGDGAIFCVWAGVGRSWFRGSWFGAFDD